MDQLVRCNEKTRSFLLKQIEDFQVQQFDYTTKTFPSILIDLVRLSNEASTRYARESRDPVEANSQQLKPFFMFARLLGRCPQVSSLMYNYFRFSTLQILPSNLFEIDTAKNVVYTYDGFSDELVKDILSHYLKYLSFNTRWFSSIWNWGELGRLISSHSNPEIQYLALCCLSVITGPTRVQHLSYIRNISDDHDQLVEIQVKNRHIFGNTFKPKVETRADQKSEQLAQSFGSGDSTYEYCSDSIAKLSNVLLLRRDISFEDQSIVSRFRAAIESYVPIPVLTEVISKIAYSISINKPCLIKGPTGSGKTAIIDFIAAHTNRIDPPHYVKVQICDQVDSKLLIGSYVATEMPGQFEWKPGPLTKAMVDGAWLVFEDIQSAPADMAQMIHSVVENRNLSCVGSCPIKLNHPHPEFRIIFTQQSKHTNSCSGSSLKFIEKSCDVVDLPDFSLSQENLGLILDKKYNFSELSTTIIKLFLESKQFPSDSLSASRYTLRAKEVTLRGLFKYCDRLKAQGLRMNDGKLSTSGIESILLDAVDCFLSSLPREAIITAASALGRILNIAQVDVERSIYQRPLTMREEDSKIVIGRVELQPLSSAQSSKMRLPMAYTRRSLQLFESIARCIKQLEPVLLVGETGVGKTSMVQHLADLMRAKLVVINMSQQSDSSDLLGGYKPVEIRKIIQPIHSRFEQMFRKTYDADSNEQFLHHVNSLFISSRRFSQWCTYLKVVAKLCSKALGRDLTSGLLQNWKDLRTQVIRLAKRLNSQCDSNPMALAFSDGSLIRSVKEGRWILLDEINLAEPDVLQCLLLIIDSLKRRKIYMNTPTVDEPSIEIHPNFRLFACMNPSTDIGKKDLEPATRDRFTEFFVDDIDDQNELRLIVESYVKASLKPDKIEKIVGFYREIRVRAPYLSDISGNSPVYSLRTLCRALSMCSANVCGHLGRSLFESIQVSFLHQLNDLSKSEVMNLMERIIFEKSVVESPIPQPKDDNHSYTQIEGFWLQISTERPTTDPKYILTKSIKKNLESLARIICLGQRRLPILIQGNTSVGKTSLIMYLAKLSGNKCYRINNHEHTDIQDYLGRYVLRENGEITFQDGLLVTAMRKGYWIILDELNLAPSELLEALNRVLDDNRELFIPETRETIKAHSKFVLFATQNPPQEYAGRKLLSRAFRNRFVEIHFDDLHSDELEIILQEKCEMPPKYAKKIVAVMRELQLFRRESGCFNGKNGFMNMRDLLRWGERYAQFKQSFPDNQTYDWEEHLAIEGLILLEGRVRTLTEAETVKTIIEKIFNVKLNRQRIYNQEKFSCDAYPAFKHIHFSQEFQRMFVQLTRALKYKEPVLLCGQTGCGKTTACQVHTEIKEQLLITYNCHQGTESSDFVGGVRPTRDDSIGSLQPTFPWIDGQLVNAMKKGAMFLMDEISLADDAVLERINSVLEPSRSITLSEKDGEEIFANEAFRLVATMNPGGDYGKKELSPALRNRFTEIYCHNTVDLAQIRSIIEKCLTPLLLAPKITTKILTTIDQFLREYYKKRDTIYLRDIISWCKFLNTTTNPLQSRPLSIQEAIVNGAALIFFDQMGTCGHKMLLGSDTTAAHYKSLITDAVLANFGRQPVNLSSRFEGQYSNHDVVRFKKFHLPRGPNPITSDIRKEFVTDCPTVKRNLTKLARAMQLDRPILLEGDPGVGKTSLISTMAKLTGHNLVRINLSEQTDICDLLGQDLPDVNQEDGKNPRFCWYDGPMLRAIKNSDWILLDEMNLASQSVLEGLNACFDHRGEIFIPELDKKLTVDRSRSRIFACQNPYIQGAARKGLPQSFLNRFTSIYIETHSLADLKMIVENLYPAITPSTVQKMIEFNNQINLFYKCAGFEFNLRDILYWCELSTKYVGRGNSKMCSPEKFASFVYTDCMRTPTDRLTVQDAFEKVFGYPIYDPPYREVRLGEHNLSIGRSVLRRHQRPVPHLPDLCILKYQMPYIESLAKALEHNKMPILVGDSQVGKRSMVRILAGLTGNKLNILGANQEMDTVELLGSYEQKSIEREVVDLVEEARQFVTTIVNSVSYKDPKNDWVQLFAELWSILYQSDIASSELQGDKLIESRVLQLSQLRELIKATEKYQENKFVRKSKDLSSKIAKTLQKITVGLGGGSSLGIFDWIDSILIDSLRLGSWLMIQNANLLNPATLDRLNSLVEVDGSLNLNEKGAGPDGIEQIKPHPNFRLILTVNPEYHELSRAMRNRGVEICVQTRFYFEDFLMILNQNGYEPEEGKACMLYCIMQTCYDFHKWITGEDPADNGSVLAHFGINYITPITLQVCRGADLDKVLAGYLTKHYSDNGFAEECTSKDIFQHVFDLMTKYRDTYVVKLVDEQYKWMHFRHDLVAMTGGDALPIMVERDNRIFYDDFNVEMVLKSDELVEDLDIVNSCVSIKIFFDQASPADFEQRWGLVKETFQQHPELLAILDRHLKDLRSELIPLIRTLLPKSNAISMSEVCIDSRNLPDLHYFIKCLDYDGSRARVGYQNRWIVSMQRLMLNMIVELIEQRSMSNLGNTSLLQLSKETQEQALGKEQLKRPVAEIAVDLHDLLVGLLSEINNRCLNSRLVSKVLPRLFWLNCFICKLRKGHGKNELIAICNQIPMLWALTYQKIICPLISDFQLTDLIYKKKKFSTRIQEISKFLNTPLEKPSQSEKKFYKKIVNTYATSIKYCDTVSREADRLYSLMAGRSSQRSEDVTVILAYSGLIWTKSTFVRAMFDAHNKLSEFEAELKGYEKDSQVKSKCEDVAKILSENQAEFDKYDEKLRESEPFRNSSVSLNRAMPALDQSAPIWQKHLLKFILAKIHPDSTEPTKLLNLLHQTLRNVNGLFMSPKFYGCLIKFLNRLVERSQLNVLDYSSICGNEQQQLLKENAEMYSSFLIDLLQENLVLDQQVVVWTRSRVATCDLALSAPLIPEYSPILSLVASYSLDMDHLKLNSCLNSRCQLDYMLVHMFRNYTPIKLGSYSYKQDLELAKNLLHLRSQIALKEEFVGDYQCPGGDNSECKCIEHYVSRRVSSFLSLITRVDDHFASTHQLGAISASIKLIYLGHLFCLEHAPIFTIDPSLRVREKLEVYKAELAHIKLELHLRNTLYYWKTGENLQLEDVDSDDSLGYPFTIRMLIERRAKLERSISKLRREHHNRPKTNDDSSYLNLRRDVEIIVDRYTGNIQALITEFTNYISSKVPNLSKLTNLTSRCQMMAKSLEKSIAHLRSEYSLYSDLMANFLAGACIVQQALRCLFFNLAQANNLSQMGFTNSFQDELNSAFALKDMTGNNFEMVESKLQMLTYLNKVIPPDELNAVHSKILKSILEQMHNQVIISPSDIPKCLSIVRRVARLYHSAWQDRKVYIEQTKKEREALYQYKVSRTTLGREISLERQEFIQICTRFPTYEHLYSKITILPLTTADEQNLATEEQVINLNKTGDIASCLDICKSYYKLMIEASRSLLGQLDSGFAKGTIFPNINLQSTLDIEAETLYSISRHCILGLDERFDSLAIDYHLVQNKKVAEIRDIQSAQSLRQGTLNNSFEILDEEVFNIYHDGNPEEATRMQKFIQTLTQRVVSLRNLPTKGYDTHPTLNQIVKLMIKISSFLVTDPLMKLVTGAHALLDRLESFNVESIPREDRLTKETEDLIALIKIWRRIEVESWQSALHWVKRSYMDGALCDLWFHLYDAFNDPIRCATNLLRDKMDDPSFTFTAENHELLYLAFIMFIKNFLEDSTHGDYQLRLDLVYSFAIQTRFASPNQTKWKLEDSEEICIDYEKLTIFVYNTHRQYQSLFKPVDEILEKLELQFSTQLRDEIRIVAWQGRNLLELKNNFRLSHRKLNSAMTKYLNCLRQLMPNLSPQANPMKSSDISARIGSDSQNLNMTLTSIQVLVDSLQTPNYSEIHACLRSILNSPKTIDKFKSITIEVIQSITAKHVAGLVVLEENLEKFIDLARHFYDHKVEDVVIHSKDSKEIKAEKEKLCRQMYNSKKFSVQTLFKILRQLGLSYQRGLHSEEALDIQILSLEPVRDMIKTQSKITLDAASKLIDKSIISCCHEKYWKLISNNLALLAQSRGDDLSSDQIERIRGFSIDLTQNIIAHNKSAAEIYRHLMSIQAAANRLEQLKTSSSACLVVVHNFSKTHRIFGSLNDLVIRSYLAISKISGLIECCDSAFKIEQSFESSQQDFESSLKSKSEQDERRALANLMPKGCDTGSFIEANKLEDFKINLVEAQNSISSINDQLADKLNNNNRNYIYSQDDVVLLRDLHKQLEGSLSSLIGSSQGAGDLHPNTPIGSIMSLLKRLNDEIWPEIEALPMIKIDRDETNDRIIDLVEHPKVEKIDIRLHKLLKEMKLVMQEIWKFEQDLTEEPTAKKHTKPFDFIDTRLVAKTLRLEKVAKHLGDVFLTINSEDCSVEVGHLVDNLSPMTYIYTQKVAAYLNTVFTALSVKLDSANQVVVFFTDIVTTGFGLPYKVDDQPADSNGQKQGKMTEDNTGFGDGEGATDVSKKLEYESQLDGLKGQQQEGEGEDKETVDAHDDGVEMSDDIGGKAVGADHKQSEVEPKEADQDNDEEEDETEGLDKEMDAVDDDEGQLDQRLWSDEETGFGDDDEQDLRDAAVNESKVDSKTELGAKDQNLTTSADQKPKKEESAYGEDDDIQTEQTADSPDKQPQDGTSDHQAQAKETGQSEAELEDNASDNSEQQADQLDLEQESALATANQEAQNNQEAENGGADNDEQDLDLDQSIDMSLEDIDAEADSERSEQESKKSDGECESSQNDDASSCKDTQEDDSNLENDIHRQIEVPIGQQANFDHPVEKSLRSLGQMAGGPNSSGGHQDERDLEIPGSYTLYPESPRHDPLDADDELSQQDSDCEPAPRDSEDSIARPRGGESAKGMEGLVSGSLPDDEQQEQFSQASETKRGKRSQAETNKPIDIPAKRLKIEQSSGDEPDQSDGQSKQEGSSVRHVEKTNPNDIDVIDLCSDSDNENLADTNAGEDQSEDNNLKPTSLSANDQAQHQVSKESQDSTAGPESTVEEQPTLEDTQELQIDEDQVSMTISSIHSDPYLDESLAIPERDLNSSYNTNLGLLKYISLNPENSQDMNGGSPGRAKSKLLDRIERELSKMKSGGEHDSVDADMLANLWLECTRHNEHLFNELCHQLQIALQPTSVSRYKGDYKSGKRLNMRKIIAYIASNYRKDKIWLRRTKPNKRNYNICIAVDNSTSMSENNCRLMTFQSLALLAKSLSRIDAGQLSVMSFGEQVRCIHEFGQPYMEAAGAQWLREFRFNEVETSYNKLLDYACQTFSKQAQTNNGSSSNVSQLLIIISDGRNVSAQANEVQSHLRRLKSMRVLTLFVIIDDLKQNCGNSIIDLKKAISTGGRTMLVNYMELFPFPFYVLLRKLETMPSILGDALRQWFELVSQN